MGCQDKLWRCRKKQTQIGMASGVGHGPLRKTQDGLPIPTCWPVYSQKPFVHAGQV